MYIIATSIGFVLKFNSLEDLRKVVEHLDGMGNWAEKEIKEGQSVKLAYIVYDKAISSKKAQELLDTFPEIEVLSDSDFPGIEILDLEE